VNNYAKYKRAFITSSDLDTTTTPNKIFKNITDNPENFVWQKQNICPDITAKCIYGRPPPPGVYRPLVGFKGVRGRFTANSWRHQLYGALGHMLPRTISVLVHFGVNLRAIPSKYCVVCEISWCRCQQLAALSISTALLTKLLVIEQLLHPALKFTVSAPWPNFQCCPSSQLILATLLKTKQFTGRAKIFTALHEMQTRSSDENSVCLSVCLFVRLSVCHTRDPWQNGRKIGPDFYTMRKNIYPSFLRTRMVGGGRPLLREILGQPTPVGTKSPIFNQ